MCVIAWVCVRVVLCLFSLFPSGIFSYLPEVVCSIQASHISLLIRLARIFAHYYIRCNRALVVGMITFGRFT